VSCTLMSVRSSIVCGRRCSLCTAFQWVRESLRSSKLLQAIAFLKMQAKCGFFQQGTVRRGFALGRLHHDRFAEPAAQVRGARFLLSHFASPKSRWKRRKHQVDCKIINVINVRRGCFNTIFSL
jgi:hypothetical protein